MFPRTCSRWMRLALTLGVAVAAGAEAQTYTVVDLGSLGPFETFAFAVSDSSRAVGFSYVPLNPPPGYIRHAFLWQDGQMKDLGTLVPGGYSWATDINEAGQISGHADATANGPGHPFLYKDGTMQDLQWPNGQGEARGLNDLTQVVGYSVTSGGLVTASFWSPTGGFEDLTGSTGGTQGLAEDLNNHTRVVGWAHGAPCGGWIGPRGTLWEKQGAGWIATDLGTLGTSCFGHAYAINETGQVVGDSGGISQETAVLWQKTGGAWTIKSLGTLGGANSTAYAVNNRNQIVGQAQISGGVYHAFLWQCNSMIDLNSRIPAGSGWVLNAATGINDLGEIVGYGKLNGGNYRGFLLKPASTAACCGPTAIPVDPAAEN